MYLSTYSAILCPLVKFYSFFPMALSCLFVVGIILGYFTVFSFFFCEQISNYILVGDCWCITNICGYLLCSIRCSEHLISQFLRQAYAQVLLLFLCYRQRNWALKRLNNSSKITRSLGGRGRSPEPALLSTIQCSMPATSSNTDSGCNNVLVESVGFSRQTTILCVNNDHFYLAFFHASCWIHSFVNILSFLRKSDPLSFSFSTGTYCHFFLLRVGEAVVFRGQVYGKQSVETLLAAPTHFLLNSIDCMLFHCTVSFCFLCS